MEVRLKPEVAAKVIQWSEETGQPVAHLVEGAIEGYFNEVEELRATLDRRYDDIVSGKVQGMDGPEVVRLIRERAAARRKSIA
jgi:predicted DNA-binding protein